MKANPYCRVCGGTGLKEEPYYSDFAPSTRWVDCPCTAELPWGWWFSLILISLVGLIVCLYYPAPK